MEVKDWSDPVEIEVKNTMFATESKIGYSVEIRL